MSRLSLRLLGPPQIEIDGKVIKINRRKATALLTYLAVTQQSHSRDALATMLWPEADQSRSRASLRSTLWALNKTALEEWLLVEAETVALRTWPGSGDPETDSERMLDVDVIRFQDLLSTAKRHDHADAGACAGCLDLLSQAVSLYEDDFLAGFTLPDAPEFDEWHFFQAESLRQNLATALQTLIALHNAQGNPGDAIPYARRLVALDPLSEPAQRTLMQQYAEAGQQSAALRQYEICRQALESELGLEPSAETVALYKQLKAGELESRASSDPTPSPHNLPPETTPFVGRQQERTRLAAFLDDPVTRLLTITGPGGIGKTRLALAAARDQLSRTNFSDGIYFVSLAPLSEPEAMIPAIAEAIGYPFQADKRSPQEQIVDFLRQKTTLLLLDNFEQLLIANQPDGAALVADLLQGAPHLKILVTSREPLKLYQEQRYPLGGLDISDSESGDAGTEYAAAALFLQTARRHQPHFKVAPADSIFLAEICRLVEGMPLALELAASWIEILSLREIAAEIRHNLDLMKTNMRNIPARHRSMQAVFDASWQRLSATEQRVYAQLSVFRGSFTAEAARAVADASLTTLASLVNQSLLRPSPGKGRYEIHELLRQYTALKLQDTAIEEESVRDRHAAYYCAFLNGREADLKGARQQEALGEMEADGENSSVAWRWAAEKRRLVWLEQALVSLALFYQWNGRLREGEAMCRLAVDRLTQSEAARDGESLAHLLVKLLTWQSLFELAVANYENARQTLQRAQVILDGPALRHKNTVADKAFLLLQLSEAAKIQTFGGDALALNEESLSLYRSIDDAWGVTLALDALGQLHQSLGNYDLAVKLQEECLAIRKQLADPRGIATSYSHLGHYFLFAGQVETSERYLRKSLDLFRGLDTRADLRRPLLLLGINLLFGGKFQESIDFLEACWAIHRELGMPHEPASANVGIARAKINLGRYEEARSLSEADLLRYKSLKHKWYIAFTLFNLGRIAMVAGDGAQAKNQLQESAEILLEMEDRPLVPDVLFCLAFVHRQLGERQQAIQAMTKALNIALENAPLKPMRFELPAMALLSLDAGDKERAVELYAAACQSPYIANSRWFEDIAGREIAQAASELPPDVVAAAKARGRARDLLATANALLAELRRTNLEEQTTLCTDDST